MISRRTALKAVFGGLGVLGCREESRPLQIKRLMMAQKIVLIDAMCIVECGMHPKVYDRYIHTIKEGKHGEEGPLQITIQYVDDIIRISGRHVAYEARLIMASCRGMMLMYWEHYATVERIGREPTLEDLARIHNGGPNGWRKESTKPYWEKVKKELERMTNGA